MPPQIKNDPFIYLFFNIYQSNCIAFLLKMFIPVTPRDLIAVLRARLALCLIGSVCSASLCARLALSVVMAAVTCRALLKEIRIAKGSDYRNTLVYKYVLEQFRRNQVTEPAETRSLQTVRFMIKHQHITEAMIHQTWIKHTVNS